ncbi:MAG: hypothetical protein R3E95_16870 [Thiolinea sp.]
MPKANPGSTVPANPNMGSGNNNAGGAEGNNGVRAQGEPWGAVPANPNNMNMMGGGTD